MSHPPPDPPEESALPLSESSMLERLEQDLREGAPLQATPESDPDSVAADTLIRLNNTFCRPQQPPLTHIDRFEIRRELGRGQFGVVYLAWDPKLKREVAVKVAGVRVLLDDGLRQRFERETQLTARLNHPGLVRVHEVGECEGTPFYVMPVAEGISLREWLNQRAEPMVLSEAVQLVIDVADALHHGHELGNIHRDIKPANIMIRPVSNDDVRKWQVCVLDFGLATLADPRLRETEGGMLLGTPMYMSPEQAEGRRDEVSAASDQFSLGCLLYELITGRAVFQADHLPQVSELFKRCDPPPPSSLRGDCDVELDAICRKCLGREPIGRYESVADLSLDLQAWLDGGSVRALNRMRFWPSVACWLQRRGRLPVVGLAVLSLTPISVIGFLFLSEFSGDASVMSQPFPEAMPPAVSLSAPAVKDTIAAPTPSPRSSYLRFDGNGGSVRIPHLRIAATETLTAECWVRRRAAPNTFAGRSQSNCLFSIGDPGRLSNADNPEGLLPTALFSIATHEHNGFLAADQRLGASLHAIAVYDDSLQEIWTHVACVCENGKLEFFVDGQAGARCKLKAPAVSLADIPDGQICIGGRIHASGATVLPFAGDIDEFRLSSIVRYREPFVPQQEYEVDEYTTVLFHCDSNDSAKGCLSDSSGNGHNGTIGRPLKIHSEVQVLPLQPLF